MTITYWLKEKPKDPAPEHKPAPEDPNELKLEIFDGAGKLVRTLSSVAKPNRYPKDDPDEPKKEAEPDLTKDEGLNRAQWDLRYEGSKRLPQAKIDSGNPDDGPMALPGKYTLKLTVNGQAYTSVGEILADPRSPVPPEQLRQNFEFALAARAALDRLVDDIEEVRAIDAQTADIKQRTAANPAAKELQAAADAVLKLCDALEHRMHNPEAEVAYDVLAGRQGGAKLYSQIAPLFTDIQNSDYAPTQGQLSQMEENLADLKAVEAELGTLRNGDLARLEAQAKALALPRVILPQAQ
jgi:hypothetical protein